MTQDSMEAQESAGKSHAEVTHGAIISDCGTYRYALWRKWGAQDRTLLFVMLNPSTADASVDDPTIRRCIAFGQRLGFDGVEVVNLYAFRATDPKDLKRAGYPVGPDNDGWIIASAEHALETSGEVCVAWGAEAAKLERPHAVLWLLRRAGVEPMCLGITRGGYPRHPLYLRSDAPLVPFSREAIQEAMAA